ncbi:uncharacterized protein LOC123305319 [Chrysoperla carnea]|uniref:uncharacterized protein LOC123305319 n=1 Tax=Chrysoperla carnea TaxID=189513 RepID=UPI001D081B65|nr:uncharacterized protein LOC123305319 [Chrysoperla carnea]
MWLNQYVDHHQADDGSLEARTIPSSISNSNRVYKSGAIFDTIFSSSSAKRYYNGTLLSTSHSTRKSSNGINGDHSTTANNGRGEAVYSASVTLTARMAPGSGDTYGDQEQLPGSRWSGNTAWWRITSERLPLLVGIFVGGFLISLILLAIIVYRCCIMPRGHKHYCARKGEEQPAPQISRSAGLSHPIYPSHSAVYVDPKNGSWTYNSRLVNNQSTQAGPSTQQGAVNTNTMHVPWPQGQRLNTSNSGMSTASSQQNWCHRSDMVPSGSYNIWTPQIQGILKRGSVSGSDGRLAIAVGVQHTPDIICSSTTRLHHPGNQVPRSSSHPHVPCPNSGSGPQSLPTYPPNTSPYNTNNSNNQSHTTIERRPRPHSQPVGSCEIIHPDQDVVHKQIAMMPQICEFSAHQISQNQYASSSILDEVGTKEDEPSSAEGTTLKTRSLPAWVRSKPRPLSTEDDLAELYAKVNFSKKRKNRMRNDEAAIIALSKSRSQFLHTNKDTDSLVDNEAVIVYDERTAL